MNTYEIVFGHFTYHVDGTHIQFTDGKTTIIDSLNDDKVMAVIPDTAFVKLVSLKS